MAKLAGGDYVFKDVANWLEDAQVDHRPDLALYPTHAEATSMYKLEDDVFKRSTASSLRKPYIARCAYPWMVAAIEVKKEGAETGFGFKSNEPLLRATEDAYKIRSQFATYAAELMLREQRTHVFTVFIAGWCARIFRWDRNGTLVSHPIDLRTESKHLFNFFYRLIRSNGSVQGFDPTATLASDAEIDLLRRYMPCNQYLSRYKDMILDNGDNYPIYVVCAARFSVSHLTNDPLADRVRRGPPIHRK